MKNKLKKVSFSVILFLLLILILGQVQALSEGEHDVTLEGDNKTNYPFIITSVDTRTFCNQHGGSLNDGRYEFTKDNDWTSENDWMAYIFSKYENGINSVSDTEYRALQYVIWNTSSLNNLYDNKNEDKVNTKADKWDSDDERKYEEDFGEKAYSFSTSLPRSGAVLRRYKELTSALGSYVSYYDTISDYGGYECVLNKNVTDPVAVDTDEKTYIVGTFSIKYKKWVIDDEVLANITSIDVINTDTGKPIDNVLLQRDKDGYIYQGGEDLPQENEEFNVILPYNESAEEVKHIKLVVNYEYVNYFGAHFESWQLGQGTYDWQRQLSMDGATRPKEPGTAELVPNSSWEFELLKTGELNCPLGATFHINVFNADTGDKLTNKPLSLTTDSNTGRGSIKGLEFFGNLKMEIEEITTPDGYVEDNDIKTITFTKKEGATEEFQNITGSGTNLVEVGSSGGTTLSAEIENIPVEDNDYTIKLIKMNDNGNMLTGSYEATFKIKLYKIDKDGSEEVVYYKGSQKLSSLKITEQKMRAYLAEKYNTTLDEVDFNLLGDYRIEMTETSAPKNYKKTLENKTINMEFKVKKNGETEITSKPSINNEETSWVKTETDDAQLTIYIKNERRISGGGDDYYYYYQIHLDKYLTVENQDGTITKGDGKGIKFNITLSEILSDGTLKEFQKEKEYTTDEDGKITLKIDDSTSLTKTGDILIKIEEEDRSDIVGSRTKYIRYKATHETVDSSKDTYHYYKINGWNYADEKGNILNNSEDGITCVTGGTSSHPTLTMQVENYEETIDLTMDIAGTVFLDDITGKMGSINGKYDKADTPMEGIEVTLCTPDGTPVAREGLTNPTRTDSEGKYGFAKLDAMQKYIIKYRYNGQDYINTDYFSDDTDTYKAYHEAARGGSDGLGGYDLVSNWEQYSKAMEDMLHGQEGDITRDNLNKRFGEIASYTNTTDATVSNSYERTDDSGNKTGTYNVAYSDEVMKEVYDDILEAIQKGNNTSSEIEEYLKNNKSIENLDKKLTFAKDCEIVAYTDKYPAMNKFTISNEENDVYSVDLSTKTHSKTKENYPGLYASQDQELDANKEGGQKQINFGLVERQNVDLRLSEDILQTEVEENGQTKQIYKYNKRLANGEPASVGVRESDIGTYTNYIRSTDIYLNGSDDPSSYDPTKASYSGQKSDLKLDVIYQIQITNESPIWAEVTEVADFYDKTFFSFVDAYLGDQNGFDETKKLWAKPESKQQKTYDDGTYKAVYIDPSKDKEGNDLGNDNILTNNAKRYIYVRLTSNDDQARQMLYTKLVENNEELRTKNYSEIYVYQTWNAQNRNDGTPGLVDCDSIAGNFDVAKFEKEPYDVEDDTSAAPHLVYQLPTDDIRTLSGNVSEDVRTNLSEKEVSKEPWGNKDLNAIEGIQVELVEIKNGEEKVRQVVETNKNGEYTFCAFIPGKYVIRFTYGDKLYTVGGKDRALSGQDYQSTYANPSTDTIEGTDIKTKYWYAEPSKDPQTKAIQTDANGNVIYATENDESLDIKNNTLRYSDAYDKVQSRTDNISYSETAETIDGTNIALNYYKTTMLKEYQKILETKRRGDPKYKDANGNEYDLNDKYIEALIKANTMTAYTSTLELEVEFARTSNIQEVGRTYSYHVEHIDFGVIKRAESNLELEKHISHIKITQPDTTILLDADVAIEQNAFTKKEEIKLKSTADGTYVQNDKVHFQSVPTANGYGTVAAKLEIDDGILHGNTLEITYTLQVHNTTPRTTSLTWFEDEGKPEDHKERKVAVGYYQEQADRLVYYEYDYDNNTSGIRYYENDDTKIKTTVMKDDIKRNEEKVTTQAKQIVDYIPTNIHTVDANNVEWTQINSDTRDTSSLYQHLISENVKTSVNEYNEILVADTTQKNPLTEKALLPGQSSDPAKVVLSVQTTEDVDLNYTNMVEITELTNTAGRVDTVSTPGNLDPKNDALVDFKKNNHETVDDDSSSLPCIQYTDDTRTKVVKDSNPYTSGVEGHDKAEEQYMTTSTSRTVYEPDSDMAEYVLITDSTGDTHYYYVLMGSMLVLFAAGVIGIKKFVLNKKIK